MKTKRSLCGGRVAATALAIAAGIGSPLAVAAQEASPVRAAASPRGVVSETPIPVPVDAVPAEAGDVQFADPVIDSPASFERNPALSGIHRALGWATVAAGLATGILNPEVVGEDVHASLGITSAALAASTMLFGFLAHYGEVGPKFKLSANNVHAVLGAAGGLMMMIAPFVAPSEAHAALGEGGALLMGASIVWKIAF